MFDTNTPLAASLVATVVLLVFAWGTRGPRERRWLGPAADGWEYARALMLPPLDRLLRRRVPGQHYAAYMLSLDEVVGVIDAPPEEVESMLYRAGFRRMPLAAYKSLPEVAAHQEANALSPFTALEHYRGVGYDVPAGEREVRRRLDEGVWEEG